MLSRCQKLVDELNSTNENNAKLTIMSKYEDLKSLIAKVYDPLLPFHVTSAGIKKTNPKCDPVNVSDIMELMDMLSSRSITGHEAAATIQHFVGRHKEYEELIYRILDKDLKIRMGLKQINKVFPGLIQEFSTALGETLNEKTLKLLDQGSWYISRKLDGVRCLCFVGKSNVIYRSRVGNEFTTLGKLTPIILSQFKEGDVIDGEVCIFNGKNEDFQAAMKVIRKNNYTIPEPRYKVFDLLTKSEFDRMESERTFKERHSMLKSRMATNTSELIEVISQWRYSANKLEKLVSVAEKKGWEGLIVRKDTSYEGKRSKSILKVKKFDRIELRVNQIVTGPFQVHNKKTGLTETIETMTAVVVPYEGNTVKVGSGFTVKERNTYYKHPTKIIDKVISIQYFEKTKDQDGNPSLRFPTFKGVYGDDRTF